MNVDLTKNHSAAKYRLTWPTVIKFEHQQLCSSIKISQWHSASCNISESSSAKFNGTNHITQITCSISYKCTLGFAFMCFIPREQTSLFGADLHSQCYNWLCTMNIFYNHLERNPRCTTLKIFLRKPDMTAQILFRLKKSYKIQFWSKPYLLGTQMKAQSVLNPTIPLSTISVYQNFKILTIIQK